MLNRTKILKIIRLKKKNHLPNLHFFGSMLIFQVVYPCLEVKQKTPAKVAKRLGMGKRWVFFFDSAQICTINLQ